MTETRPDGAVRLLPGASAYRLAVVTRYGLVVIVSLLVIDVCNLVLHSYLSHTASTITGTVLFVAVSSVVGSETVVGVLALVRAKLEVEAGYTTSLSLYQNVPQLHPRTGVVLREAGDEYLNADQLRAAGLMRASPRCKRANR